jgi:phosphoglycerol transferase
MVFTVFVSLFVSLLILFLKLRTKAFQTHVIKDICYLGITILLLFWFLICIYGVNFKFLFLPWGYSGGDEMFLFLKFQNIIDSGWALTNQRLSAPFTADFFDFYVLCLDIFVQLVFRCVYMLSANLIFAVNMCILIFFVLNASTSYIVLRAMHIDCRISMMSALTYAIFPFFFLRTPPHFELAAYQFVPLAVLLCFWCYTDDSFFILDAKFFKTRKNVIGLTFAILIPMGGSAYYAYFACFFILITGLIKSKFKINKKLMPSLSLIIIMITILLLCLSPHFVYDFFHGQNLEGIRRNQFDNEVYGFKILQLFLPTSAHGIGWLNRLIYHYNTLSVLVNENRTSYLGMMGSIGCICLFIFLFIKHIKNKTIFLLSRLNVAAVLLSTIGGFSTFVCLFTNKIRAYNRISVFIAFFGILTVALYANKFLQKLNKQKAILFLMVYIIISTFGVFWQYPFSLLNQYLDQVTSVTEPLYESDAKFVADIENVLPKGSMVYQMPFQKFPENGPRHKMSDYQLVTGLIHSKDLRWSYGAMHGRYADRWHQIVDTMPLEGKIKILSLVDFQGIYIDRTAYTEDTINSMEASLSDILGIKAMYSDNNNLSFFNMTAYNASFKSSHTVEYLDDVKKSLLEDEDIANNESILRYTSIYQNLDLAKTSELHLFTRGVFHIENHEIEPFVWIEPDATIYLKHDDINAKTIEIDLMPIIYGLPHAKNPETINVFINNVPAHTTLVNSPDRRVIKINTDKLTGIAQNIGYYKIEIITDGLYNPYKSGDSSDNRDLALRLFGITIY